MGQMAFSLHLPTPSFGSQENLQEEKNHFTTRKIAYGVIPPDADAEFAASMEEVLDVYARFYDPRYPVLGMDEQPIQLLKETRIPIAGTRKHPRRVDYEYQRAGTASLFMFGEPLRGGRHVSVRGYAHAAPLEAVTIARWQEAEVVHFDETGLRVAGKLYWLHTASTSEHTHLFVHPKRGQEALTSAASVLNEFTGIAVHDCWSPYFKFTKARHVLCGAYLLRELHGLKEGGSRWAAAMHEFLLDLHKRPHPIAAADAVQKPYPTILEQADQEEPPPQPSQRGKPQQTPGRNLLDRLRTHQDGVLAFTLDAGVPFTNNQAERDLRPAKVKLKVSGGFRTVEGACVYARLQAVISTFRKQGEGVFARLRELFSPPHAAAAA